MSIDPVNFDNLKLWECVGAAQVQEYPDLRIPVWDHVILPKCILSLSVCMLGDEILTYSWIMGRYPVGRYVTDEELRKDFSKLRREFLSEYQSFDARGYGCFLMRIHEGAESLELAQKKDEELYPLTE